MGNTASGNVGNDHTVGPDYRSIAYSYTFHNHYVRSYVTAVTNGRRSTPGFCFSARECPLNAVMRVNLNASRY